MTTFVVIIPQETLQAFTHPALDLTSGCLVELEPAPVQLDLFEPDQADRTIPTMKIEQRHTKDEPSAIA